MILEKYEHFLRSNKDVTERVVQSLWKLKKYTATVFEKTARQPTLDKCFNENQTSGMKCELANEKSVTMYLKM
jgi:hypothetical protein